MKDKCPGSGKLPRYEHVDYGVRFGDCTGCPSQRRLRKDGKLPAHKPSPNYNAMVRDLLRIVR